MRYGETVTNTKEKLLVLMGSNNVHTVGSCLKLG